MCESVEESSRRIGKDGTADLRFRRLLTKRRVDEMRFFVSVLYLLRCKGKDALHTVSVYARVHLLLCPEILDSIGTDCDALVHIVCHLHSDFLDCADGHVVTLPFGTVGKARCRIPSRLCGQRIDSTRTPKLIRFAGDNCVGSQPLLRFGSFPVFSKPGKGERAAIFNGDRERSFGVGVLRHLDHG